MFRGSTTTPLKRKAAKGRRRSQTWTASSKYTIVSFFLTNAFDQNQKTYFLLWKSFETHVGLQQCRFWKLSGVLKGTKWEVRQAITMATPDCFEYVLHVSHDDSPLPETVVAKDLLNNIFWSTFSNCLTILNTSIRYPLFLLLSIEYSPKLCIRCS